MNYTQRLQAKEELNAFARSHSLEAYQTFRSILDFDQFYASDAECSHTLTNILGTEIKCGKLLISCSNNWNKLVKYIQ